MRDSFIRRVKAHEGFRSTPYKDTVGVWTFGHGLTYITEDESDYIVRKRLDQINNVLSAKINKFTSIPIDIREVLIEMAYQMGVQGLLAFRLTLSLIQEGNYTSAADAMLESKWASQTPVRAKELSDIVRNTAKWTN